MKLLIHSIAERLCVKHCASARRLGRTTRFGRFIFHVVSAIEFRLRRKKANGGYSYHEAPNH